jgi:hypothetical protein
MDHFDYTQVEKEPYNFRGVPKKLRNYKTEGGFINYLKTWKKNV